jgi:hypothetical protein
MARADLQVLLAAVKAMTVEEKKALPPHLI